MSELQQQALRGSGLLANGSTAHWDFSVDESLSDGGLSLEIDGPRVYLVFQLEDASTIHKMLEFLKRGLETGSVGGPNTRRTAEDVLPVGRFGALSVSLLLDDEGLPRCFLAIGPRAESRLRVTLEEADLREWTEALDQIEADLSA